MLGLHDPVDETAEDAVRAILADARTQGLRGFGGGCMSTAVAINRVLFDGQGLIVGGLNIAFHEHGLFHGHAAVLWRDGFWDADGRPKHEDEIVSWGMLDPGDSYWCDQAVEYGIAWSEDVAMDAGMWEFADEALFVAAFCDEHDVAVACTILTKAVHAWQVRKSALHSLLQGIVRCAVTQVAEVETILKADATPNLPIEHV